MVNLFYETAPNLVRRDSLLTKHLQSIKLSNHRKYIV